MRAAEAVWIFVLACCGLATSYGSPIRAFVSIPPEAYIIQRIGGDEVQVEALTKPWQSPETFDISPEQMIALSKADLYFTLDLPFEQALTEKLKKQHPKIKIVSLRQGIPLRKLEEAHNHEGHHHSPLEWDPHIWLNPKLVVIQCTTILDALIEQKPTAKTLFENNAALLIQELEALHRSLQTMLEPVRGKPFFVYHPAFGYFADAYGLKQVSIEYDGKSPSLKRLESLQTEAQQKNVRTLFIQPEFEQAQAKQLAKNLGAELVTLDPLAYNYLENIYAIAENIYDRPFLE